MEKCAGTLPCGIKSEGSKFMCNFKGKKVQKMPKVLLRGFKSVKFDGKMSWYPPPPPPIYYTTTLYQRKGNTQQNEISKQTATSGCRKKIGVVFPGMDRVTRLVNRYYSIGYFHGCISGNNC